MLNIPTISTDSVKVVNIVFVFDVTKDKRRETARRESERERERERDLFSDVAKSGNKNVRSMLRAEKACCLTLYDFVIQRAKGGAVGRAHLNCKPCARF